MIDRVDISEKYSLFEREYKRIEPYKSRRPLTADLELREEYKQCLVSTYNNLIASVDRHSIPEEEKSDILQKFASYLSKFKEALKTLNLKYNFEKGLFNQIDIALITEILNTDESIADTSANLSNLSAQNNTTDNNLNTPATMAQTSAEFIAIAHRMINYKYDGDPLALDSFIDAVDLLKELCAVANADIFRKFVMTKLEGRAREAIINPPNTIDEIIEQLKDGIKPESSKVIEGRILALRADRSSLTKFAEQAEKLADDFKRSLCLEGFSRDKAKEIAIEKTVEMCRKSAKNDTVKAILAATKFSEPKEAIAKMIIEINNLKQDRVQTSYSHKYGNSNKFSGNNNNRSNNGRNGNGSQNNGYQNNGYQNNGRSNGNRNNSNNNRNNNNYNGNRSNYQRNDRNGQSNYGNQNYRGNNGTNFNRSNNDQNVRIISGNETNPGNGGLQMIQ